MNIRVMNALRKIAGVREDIVHTVQGFQPHHLLPWSKADVPTPTAEDRQGELYRNHLMQSELLRQRQEPNNWMPRSLQLKSALTEPAVPAYGTQGLSRWLKRRFPGLQRGGIKDVAPTNMPQNPKLQIPDAVSTYTK